MYNRANPLDPAVFQHRAEWLQRHGLSVDSATRLAIDYTGTNFCRYQEVGAAEFGVNMLGFDGLVADALVTRTPGHTLFLPIADCIAAVIYDPEHQVLMLTHLGRHSLEQDGGQRSVEHLTKTYGSRPAALTVWLSPAIGKELYPIFLLDNKGMKEVAFEQLAAAGIVPDAITDTPADTGTDERYYSYSEFRKGNKPEDGCHAVAAVFS